MSMQYQGKVTVGSTGIFVTGATLNLAATPIAPELIWGSGWQVNYASGHFDPTFTVNFPWFQTYSAGGFLAQCIDENTSGTGGRNTPTTATLFNGGLGVTFAGARCASLQFTADAIANTPLNCTATFGGTSTTVFSTHPSPNTPPANVDGQTPVPAYAMTATGTLTSSGGGSLAIASSIITAFEVTANNNIFKLYTMNGSRFPTDVQLGLMEVTGSFTFYSNGVALTQPATDGAFSVSGGGLTFSIPKVLITGFANDITGPNLKPLAVASFRAFGTSSTPPITI